MKSERRGSPEPSHRLEKPAITEKPWGRELLVVVNEAYALKDIFMVAGTRSSLQSHRQKLETIYIVSGSVELETVSSEGKSSLEVFGPGAAYSLRPGVVHRVRVIEDARLVEVSTPHLDDIIRHADDFGRG